MTLVASGQISLANVNVELGLSSTAQISMNDTVVRTLFAVSSGAISMSDGFGKSNAPAVTPGSQNFTTPGVSNFTVPAFNTLTVNVWGGGGAGARIQFSPTNIGSENSGGTSSFGGYMSATGGAGPVYTYDASSSFYYANNGGVGGTGTGGTTNISGSSGSAAALVDSSASTSSSGGAAGGTAYGGGATRTLTIVGTVNGLAGNLYGGGGTGVGRYDSKYGGNYGDAGGGGAGFARKSFTTGQLTVGSTISVTVGAGGAGAAYDGSMPTSGSGANGAVTISWS